MKKSAILIVFAIGLYAFGNAQTADEILEKANNALQGKNYKVDILYTSYDGHESSLALEKISGSFKLFENGYVQKIDEVLIIQEDSLALQINHFHKEISLTHSAPFVTSPLDFSLDDFKDYNIKESVSESANSIIVDLEINNVYLEVSRIQFQLESGTYYPKKMILFYAGNESQDNKRLEVSFQNLTFDTKRSFDDQILSYVTLGEEDFTIVSDILQDYSKR